MPRELRTSRLLLRPFQAEDLASFERFADRPDYRRFLGEDHPSAAQLVSHNTTTDWDTEPSWVVELDGGVAGSIFLGASGERPGQLACMIDPAQWNRGIAREATAAVIGYALNVRRLGRVWATCDERNARSIHVLEALGFTFETTHLRSSGSAERLYVLTANG